MGELKKKKRVCRLQRERNRATICENYALMCLILIEHKHRVSLTNIVQNKSKYSGQLQNRKL
ncbi:unnamed protein product [Moneuplotes crassus]|uniref:Uncharacterized protein n=1 Tax=Euplotes crassus TaxID=5936 RepID=A0AAD1X533_EUPCR|nr:unnamed protein product [Moneuplotes crassus]